VGMRLEVIGLPPKQITRGLDVLRKMQSLKNIDTDDKNNSAAEFWKRHSDGEFKK
jgi:hypothetical protein